MEFTFPLVYLCNQAIFRQIMKFTNNQKGEMRVQINQLNIANTHAITDIILTILYKGCNERLSYANEKTDEKQLNKSDIHQ